MKINVFEGSRRVLKVISGISSLLLFLYLVFSINPSIYLYYTVAGANYSPVRGESLPYNRDNRSKTTVLFTKTGTRVSVDITFLARKLNDGRVLIPFIGDDGQLWGGEAYSAGVESYTQKVSESFRLTAEEEKWVDRQWWKITAKNVCVGGLYVVVWLLILNAMAWTTGWIVRGFLGIPKGMDAKPEPPAKTEAGEVNP